MEEDIKILEDFINILIDEDTGKFIEREIYVTTSNLQAMKRLIEGYKRLKKENQGLLRAYGLYKDLYENSIYKPKVQEVLKGKVRRIEQLSCKNSISKEEAREVQELIHEAKGITELL